MDLNIETTRLDDSCKAFLRKLRDNGFGKAGESYVTESSLDLEADFASLMRSGYGFAVLAFYVVPNVGPDAGKISFGLHLNLT